MIQRRADFKQCKSSVNLVYYIFFSVYQWPKDMYVDKETEGTYLQTFSSVRIQNMPHGLVPKKRTI